jgi:putative endonuclease
MYFAYVIKSLSHDYYYKGHCHDLQVRLAQHNAGKTLSIKNKIPFEIVYFEEFETLEEAVKQEKYFKSAAGSLNGIKIQIYCLLIAQLRKKSGTKNRSQT